MDPKVLRDLLLNSPQTLVGGSGQNLACVAVILRVTDGETVCCFIRRAHNPKDPWSGQIAFPGGKKDFADQDDMQTAQRETTEEIGLSIGRQDFLGYLPDIQARNREGVQNFFIRPLVFFYEGDIGQIQLNKKEVDEVFWIDLAFLQNPNSKVDFRLPGRSEIFPAIRLLTGDILWGLTHSIVTELVQVSFKNRLR